MLAGPWRDIVCFISGCSAFTFNLVLTYVIFITKCDYIGSLTKLERFVKNWRQLAIISIIIVATVTMAFFYSERRSTLCEDLVGEEFTMATGLHLSEIGYLAGIAFTPTGVNMKMIVVLTIFAIVSFGAGCTLIRLALKIAKALRDCAEISETVAIHQRKIFSLLLYQVTLPLLFNVCPQQIIIVSLFFGLDCRDIIHLLCCCLTGAQVFDPLVTFYLITPYRRALFEMARKLKETICRENSTVTVVPVSTK